MEIHIKPVIINKEEASKINQKWYFTGIPCKNNHIDKRYINTNICYECKRKNIKNDYTRHKIRIICSNKKSYLKNKSKRLANSKRWAANNLEKIRKIKRRNKLKHHDKYLEKEKIRHRNKRRYDPLFRLNRNLSKAIWSWLKGNKAFRHWEELVKYSIQDLKIHLEKKFRDGMNWDNYGKYWHVDHIKPLSLCSSFEEAWELNNLQPLLVLENLSKNNRFIG